MEILQIDKLAGAERVKYVRILILFLPFFNHVPI